MRIVVLTLTLLGAALIGYASAASDAPRRGTGDQIDYPGFQSLTKEVYAYRANRLVTLADFQKMAREPNTIILDARSADAYALGHIDGAINLSLTDFTAPALAAVIRNPNTRILIYCNNNFENEPKALPPKATSASLNLYTFNTLYSYGYTNVYELGPLIDINKSILPFDGSLIAANR